MHSQINPINEAKEESESPYTREEDHSSITINAV
jgi:hypothetical protein